MQLHQPGHAGHLHIFINAISIKPIIGLINIGFKTHLLSNTIQFNAILPDLCDLKPVKSSIVEEQSVKMDLVY